MNGTFDIVILGLTITSSWGNGHATTYRGLVKGLATRGHNVLFLERDVEWYANNRDDPNPKAVEVRLYSDLQELTSQYQEVVSRAALVIVGSYVPQGIEVGEWVLAVATGHCAFYDIDTPVTLSLLETGNASYISPGLISKYGAYFSFSGGAILKQISSRYGAQMTRALYCSVDLDNYVPTSVPIQWDLGYLGTYSEDRQSGLDQLLLRPARHWKTGRFTVVGPQYPQDLLWPDNVERSDHLPPSEHSLFYGSQKFTLNITRDAMKAAGYSPSVRLFEAAACGVPIISDWWDGLDTIFKLNSELFIAETAEDTLRFLHDVPENQRRQVGACARARVLSEHSPLSRAIQIEAYLMEMDENNPVGATRRNRRHRQVFGGIDSQLPPESEGTGAIEEPGSPIGKVSHTGRLHKPFGTNSPDRTLSCGATQINASRHEEVR